MLQLGDLTSASSPLKLLTLSLCCHPVQTAENKINASVVANRETNVFFHESLYAVFYNELGELTSSWAFSPTPS